VFSKIFGKKPKDDGHGGGEGGGGRGVMAYARINAPLSPKARGDIFEDRLIERLGESDPPLAAVTGGGQMLGPTGEIMYCGIDIDLFDPQQAPAFICDVLRRRGAPKGSRLEYTLGGKKFAVPFGEAEGVAVYLNGTDLPPEVYESCNINTVIDTLNNLVEPDEGGGGNVVELWHGPTETAIYMLGVSSPMMQEAIAPFLAEYPLCQRARVAQFAPPPHG
jgi:hypothetical protein